MEIEEFLDTFPEEIATLSRLTQAFVKGEAAECREELHVGWRVVSYGYKKSFARLRLMPSWSTYSFTRERRWMMCPICLKVAVNPCGTLRLIQKRICPADSPG